MSYDPRYFETHLSGKIFWHNVGIGLALNSSFADAYQLKVTDVSMIDAVRRSVSARDPSEVQRIFGSPDKVITRYAPGYIIDFARYELWARRLVFEAIANCPSCTLRLLFVDKPKLLAKQVLWISGLKDFSPESLMLEDQIGALHNEQRPNRVATIGALGGLGILVISMAWLRRKSNCVVNPKVSPPLVYGGLIAVCSFAPVILTYPLVHLLAVPILWTIFFAAMALYSFSSRHFAARSIT